MTTDIDTLKKEIKELENKKRYNEEFEMLKAKKSELLAITTPKREPSRLAKAFSIFARAESAREKMPRPEPKHINYDDLFN